MVKNPSTQPTPDVVQRIKANRIIREERAAVCAERRFREALVEGLCRNFGPISNETAMFIVGQQQLQ